MNKENERIKNRIERKNGKSYEKERRKRERVSTVLNLLIKSPLNRLSLQEGLLLLQTSLIFSTLLV
jgi:hypothetical protein